MIVPEIVLTGDRPTGKLHLGHYVGSLLKRVELQEQYQQFIMIADLQALTDNAANPKKIADNLHQVLLDYLAVGIDPRKNTIFVQSKIPALAQLTMYYLNLVTVARLERNPTVKTEILQRGFNNEQSAQVPAGFLIYPVAQAADITAFKATLVPVGADQVPVLEQSCEIVRKFNNLYSNILIEPKALLSKVPRLVGIDGKAKMSKSLNNAIFLADDEDQLRTKVMQMFTDPNHVHISDPGKIIGNVVFNYLDIFASDHNKLQELKEHYQRGGLGDMILKKYLFEILNQILTPIRIKRAQYALDTSMIKEILVSGAEIANQIANTTLDQVHHAIGIS